MDVAVMFSVRVSMPRQGLCFVAESIGQQHMFSVAHTGMASGAYVARASEPISPQPSNIWSQPCGLVSLSLLYRLAICLLSLVSVLEFNSFTPVLEPSASPRASPRPHLQASVLVLPLGPWGVGGNIFFIPPRSYGDFFSFFLTSTVLTPI